MNTFVIYSKPGCPYCVKIKQVMEMTNLIHYVYTLDEDFTRDQFYQQFGQGSTFPQIVYNGENLGGCVDTIKFLKENSLI